VRPPRVAAAIAAIAIATAASGDAGARPGGGSTFSGSRSSGSSSSSSSRSSSTSSSSSSRSSSSSSSSGSRSTGVSWPSSGSGSGSRSSGSSGSYTPPSHDDPPPRHEPRWAGRTHAGRARALAAAAANAPPYPPVGAHPAIPIGPDRVDRVAAAKHFASTTGLFAVAVLVLASPLLAIAWSQRRARRKLEQAWSTSEEEDFDVALRPPPRAPESSPAEVRRRMIALIGERDPDFSVPLFEDFVAALYAEAHAARGTGRLDRYAPYLQARAREALESLPRAPVSTVIVGAMSPCLVRIDPVTRRHEVTLELEANYTEAAPGAPPQAYYAVERWTLARAVGARSRPPERIRALACPSCGAPLEASARGHCRYCLQAVDSGQFDGVVTSIELAGREARGPMLTGTVPERGTSRPTIVDPGLQTGLAALRAADPGFTEAALEARVGVVFETMQRAWTSLAWSLARPCLTDRLWTAQSYWVEAYRAQGLANRTDGARITRTEIVRASRDRFHDAVTVRVHATGLDYTVRVADGAVVSGSRTEPRPYTEYWTLLRSAARAGASRGAPPCPACGAPLGLEMATKCPHCGALVESSTFDWVLSRIEQDEVYVGGSGAANRRSDFGGGGIVRLLRSPTSRGRLRTTLPSGKKSEKRKGSAPSRRAPTSVARARSSFMPWARRSLSRRWRTWRTRASVER
jgi:hypothetical protein